MSATHKIKNINLEEKLNGTGIWCVSKRWPDGTRYRRRMSLDLAKKLKARIDNAMVMGTWRELKKELAAEAQPSTPDANIKCTQCDPGMTVGMFADIYYDEYCLLHNEQPEFKKKELKNIKRIVGKIKLAEFTKADAATFQSTRKKDKMRNGKPGTVSNRTVNKGVRVLNNMFNWAVNVKQCLTVNPMAKTKRLKEKKVHRKIMRSHEADGIVNQAIQIDLLIGVFLGILSETAIRRGEGLAIRREHLDIQPDPDKCWLTVAPSKHSPDGRVVPLSKRAIELLGMLQVDYTSPYVFVSPVTGERPNRDAIEAVLFAAEKAVGCTWPRMHDFRHYRASFWHLNGVPVRTIQGFLGHQSLHTTELYLHSMEDMSSFRAAEQKELERKARAN